MCNVHFYKYFLNITNKKSENMSILFFTIDLYQP